MTLLEQSAQVKASIRAELALWDGATGEKWRFYTEPQPNGCPIIGNGKGVMVATLSHSVKEPKQKETAIANASCIARSRTVCPAALRALLVAIETIEPITREAAYPERETATNGLTKLLTEYRKETEV